MVRMSDIVIRPHTDTSGYLDILAGILAGRGHPFYEGDPAAVLPDLRLALRNDLKQFTDRIEYLELTGQHNLEAHRAVRSMVYEARQRKHKTLRVDDVWDAIDGRR